MLIDTIGTKYIIFNRLHPADYGLQAGNYLLPELLDLRVSAKSCSPTLSRR